MRYLQKLAKAKKRLEAVNNRIQQLEELHEWTKVQTSEYEKLTEEWEYLNEYISRDCED